MVATIQRMRLTGFSPSEMEGVVQTAHCNHIQAGQGAFNGEVLQMSTADKALDTGLYTRTVLATVAMPSDRVTLGLILPAQTGGRLEGEQLDLPTTFVYSEGTELGSTRLEPGTRWIGFQVSRAELESLELLISERFGGCTGCNPAELGRLVRETRVVLGDLNRSADAAVGSIPGQRDIHDRLDDLLSLFVGALSPEPAKATGTSRRYYRRLIGTLREYLHEHLVDVVRIRDLCEIGGVSYKTV